MSAEHSIVALCAALEVTPAGYHAWQRAAPAAREQTDAELAEQIAAVHRIHRGRYGAPRIQRELRDQGQAHSRKRIARLMRDRGLSAHRPRRYVPRTTDSSHDEPIEPNRIATRPAPRFRRRRCFSASTRRGGKKPSSPRCRCGLCLAHSI